MTGSQREADDGQQQVEREQSNAQVAFGQYVKDRDAVWAEMQARINAAPRAEQLAVRLECSIEFVEWDREHAVDMPPTAPVASVQRVPLTLVRDGRVIDLYADRQSA